METTIGPGLSRRQMLAFAGMAGLAAAAPALRRLALPFPFGSRSGGATFESEPGLTLARFAPHVGSRFTVGAGALGAVEVTLEEAAATAPHPADRAGLRGEAFSLVFRAAEGPALPDGVHRLTHPVLGSFALFVSAFGRGRAGQGYQAVVDRRASAR
jgi:hypothetical protein